MLAKSLHPGDDGGQSSHKNTTPFFRNHFLQGAHFWIWIKRNRHLHSSCAMSGSVLLVHVSSITDRESVLQS